MHSILKAAKTANEFVRPKKSDLFKDKNCPGNAPLCPSRMQVS